MYYVFQRDRNTKPYYLMDLNAMTTTYNAALAAQVSEDDIERIDTQYLNKHKFYAVSLPNLGLKYSPSRVFTPSQPFYRPPYAPRPPHQGAAPGTSGAPRIPFFMPVFLPRLHINFPWLIAGIMSIFRSFGGPGGHGGGGGFGGFGGGRSGGGGGSRGGGAGRG